MSPRSAGPGETQGGRHIEPLDQSLAVGQEAIDHPTEAGSGGVEGSADGIGRHLLQLTGDEGGEQGLRPIYNATINGMKPLITNE